MPENYFGGGGRGEGASAGVSRIAISVAAREPHQAWPTMLSLCCTKVIRDRLRLPPQLPAPVQPSTRLGNWYVHLARFGHQQIVLATSERSLLTVLLPARQLRAGIEISFQAAVAAH